MTITIADLERADPFRFGCCSDGPAAGLFIAVTSLTPTPDDGKKYWDVELSAPVLGIEDEVQDPMLVTIGADGELHLPTWLVATRVEWITNTAERIEVAKLFGIRVGSLG